MNTYDLDIAAAILTHGYKIKTKKLGPVHADYSFERTTETERIVKQFLEGSLILNISAYMRNRASLKRRLLHEAVYIKPLKISSDRILPFPSKGVPYWYYENGSVFHALYAESEPHLTRAYEGRLFKTKAEAEVALANVKDPI